MMAEIGKGDFITGEGWDLYDVYKNGAGGN